MLLDTCIAVDYLRWNAAAVDFISSLEKEPSLSVVTVMELFAGARSQKEEKKIEQLYKSATVLNVDIEIGKRAGIFLKHYEPSHRIGPADALIAATAEHYELELVTLNVKHFPMFPTLQRPY